MHPFLWKHGHMRDLGTWAELFVVTKVSSLIVAAQLPATQRWQVTCRTHPFQWNGQGSSTLALSVATMVRQQHQ